MKEMYRGVPFSPRTELSGAVGEADTVIPVEDVSVFPAGPNYATIGLDEGAETVLYTAKTESDLSGCIRGVEGTAAAWAKGETVARNFTAADHAALVENVAGLDGGLAGHVEDGAAHVTLTDRAAWDAKETPEGAQQKADAAEAAALESAKADATTKVKTVSDGLSMHAGNTAVHVTPEERSAWNAKETPAGAQAKADAAQAAAEDALASKLLQLKSVALTAGGWVGSSAPFIQTAAVPGVLADEAKQGIWPTPASGSLDAWTACEVTATTQGTDSLTFSAQARPEADLTVYILMLEAL